MPQFDITIVDVPRRLRKGLKRRLPRGGKFKDLTGMKHDRYQVHGFAGFKGSFAAWLCQCRCGNVFVREGAYLERSHRTSTGCGCYKRSPVPEYLRVARQSLIARCYNPRHDQYDTYGKRGITVCKRWLTSVEKFAEDMGPRPSPKHVIARRNKRDNFTPNNCNWGTYQDRSLTSAREISHNGKTQCLAAWAREKGISRQAMHTKVELCLKSGLDLSIALTTPRGKWKVNKRKK